MSKHSSGKPLNFDGLPPSEFTLNFGKYKGTRVRDVPVDYLQFIATQFEPTKKIGGIQWYQVACLELKARLKKPAHSTEVSSDLVSGAAVIDQVSIHLLKEFAVRPDKTEGIYSWTQRFAKEVRKYGKLVATNVYNYVGLVFYFTDHGTEKVLTEIRPFQESPGVKEESPTVLEMGGGSDAAERTRT